MTTWQKEEIEVKSGTNGKTRIGGHFAGSLLGFGNLVLPRVALLSRQFARSGTPVETEETPVVLPRDSRHIGVRLPSHRRETPVDGRSDSRRICP